ncbi:YoaK family protein [Rhodococcus sp. NBC_00297]|uniref:YoaK family protein n=1 Tax=Rhodococcus sp. NBC_00297 TaxID=2976005 RepID=UPI002E2CCA6F|nr:DUF1275 family protein [Rhodococcus sp. NBC_00297]
MKRTHDRRRDAHVALGLAAVAGFVDAVGFLALGGFFVSFMTGNTTRAAVELTAGHLGAASVGLVVIVSFVGGVVTGSLVGDLAGRRRKTVVLLLVAVLLAAAGVVHLGGGATLVSALIVAAAMGAENAVFERDGGISLTYMTGTLVTMARTIAARIHGRSSESWVRPLLMWAALAGGAILGAAAFAIVGLGAPVVALIAVLVAGVVVFSMGE